MGHQLRFRKGWENERLAHYLLSRFSFVAHPAAIADDLGSDFFCTIFDIVNSDGPAIEPRGSFAIQVKSSRRHIVAHNKIRYFLYLEIPFFIGVVNPSRVTMDIYTAERLPILFAKFGERKKLWLRPVTKEKYDPDNFCGEKLAGEVWLDCPYVLTLDVTDDHDDLQLKAHELKEIIRRAAFNIATRRAEEHVYDMGGGEVRILAGEGSIQHFRNNFRKRLAEVFYNLEWILNHPSVADFDENEFRLYESFYHACESFYSASRPPALAIAAHVYKRLKERLEP